MSGPTPSTPQAPRPTGAPHAEAAVSAKETGFQPSRAQRRALAALAKKRFFKLIVGGSLTDLASIDALVGLYATAGLDCLDVAPDLAVLNQLASALSRHFQPGSSASSPASASGAWVSTGIGETLASTEGDQPLVMVSLPLDPDPHFRKIGVDTDACILCGACLPLCPTEALTIDPTGPAFVIAQDLCYGCGRCLPVCPTDAFTLTPFLVDDAVRALLSHPGVEAVELHTSHADPVVLARFLDTHVPLLANKLIALCFRPDEARTDFWQASVRLLVSRFAGQSLLQIDGAPMSGSDDPEASLPALNAAQGVLAWLDSAKITLPVTISGGINAETARWLETPGFGGIAGVGMGTYARTAIWGYRHRPEAWAEGQAVAQALVARFKAEAP